MSSRVHINNIMAELARRGLLAELNAIAFQHSVLAQEILGRSHLPCFTEPRHEWWHHLKSHHIWSDARIALLHGVHHSTVRAGRAAHVARLQRNA